MDKPRTLLEAVTHFSDLDRCHAYMVARRWPDGKVTCPTCGGDHIRFDRKRRVFECNAKHPRRQFSVKVGTIMEDSPIGLDKWLPCMWMIAGCKNGISSYEVSRALGVTQKTAWFMLHRIRLAMQAKRGGGKLGGDVEVDETYIGGKARNMHADRKRELMTTGGAKWNRWAGKVAVMGLLERNTAGKKSRVRTLAVPDVRQHRLHRHINEHVTPGANVYTDALGSYKGMTGYQHHIIDHAERYADGQVHTNGMENFWSLLKRSIKGTYVSVEPFHLFRYLDEQAMRFNEREWKDADRFETVVDGIVGRRLTYKALTGAAETSDSL